MNDNEYVKNIKRPHCSFLVSVNWNKHRHHTYPICFVRSDPVRPQCTKTYWITQTTTLP